MHDFMETDACFQSIKCQHHSSLALFRLLLIISTTARERQTCATCGLPQVWSLSSVFVNYWNVFILHYLTFLEEFYISLLWNFQNNIEIENTIVVYYCFFSISHSCSVEKAIKKNPYQCQRFSSVFSNIAYFLFCTSLLRRYQTGKNSWEFTKDKSKIAITALPCWKNWLFYIVVNHFLHKILNLFFA